MFVGVSVQTQFSLNMIVEFVSFCVLLLFSAVHINGREILLVLL